MSRLASIFTCLLALLVASPLCCCAAAKEVVKEDSSSSSCCCGGGKKKEQKHEDCACAVNKVPREKMPDAAVPATPDVMLAPQPAALWLPVVLHGDFELRPEWVPAIPWHAPPDVRRALLVSRTL